MRFYFSLRATMVGLILALFMVRLALWQADRHTEKQLFIAELNRNLERPIVPLQEAIGEAATLGSWSTLIHRRVMVRGTYDFDHEMVLRNRRHEERPGVYLLTPLTIADRPEAVIVSRGFIPLEVAERSKRQRYHQNQMATFVGLIKSTSEPHLFAPQDPPAGGSNPWVDAWLRVDLAAIGKQLPYQILPVFLEIMPENGETKDVPSHIVVSRAGQEELLFLGASRSPIPANAPDLSRYPIPLFDTVVPPGRHKGYIYEWSFMALLTIAVTVLLQLRPPKRIDPRS